MIDIKDGAVFISDAHDNGERKYFYNFLLKLEKSKIYPPQLFLMGDMFDLLVGEVVYTKKFFKNSIEILNRLSKKIDIYYIEGNHDFNLKDIFPNIKTFPITKQPLICNFNKKVLLLSHGDFHQDLNYKIYTYLIRNRFILKILNILDIALFNFISKKILADQIHKNKCYKIPHFIKTIKQNIKKYDIGVTEIDFVCEGHHHQNQEFIFEKFKYINFSSFACDKSYYKITFEDEIKFIKIS